MAIVIITIIIMYIVLISWAYHNLGNMEIARKILWIIVLLLMIYIPTYITFKISQNAIQYPNDNIMRYVKNILVFIFAGINGLLVIPILCKNIEQLYQENIAKEQLLKSVITCVIILLILLVLECGYMTNTQQGILKIIEKNKEIPVPY